MPIHTDQSRLAGQLLGSYRTLALLGEGGMGRVYLAEHVRLGRKVALKRLKDSIAAQPEAVANFIAEAQAVNRIRHPHIVDITDFVNGDDGVYYLMEHLEGATLSATIRELGPLPPSRALDIGHQVADALAAAHGADVVHLDIKPSNIFLTQRNGRTDYVKLLDFGLAGLLTTLNEADPEADATQIPLGTPVYMAPEHISGRAVDHRADLYSLGCVLYEMLAGKPPFDARSGPEYVHRHLNVPPTPLAYLKDLPHRIPVLGGRLVMRCLEKDPADRPQSAAELRDELAAVARSTQELRLSPGQAPVPAPRQGSRRRFLALAGAAVTLGAGGAAAYLALRERAPARRSTPRPGDDVPTGAARRGPDRPGAPPKMRLRVNSTPAGAQVFRVDRHEVLLGITPLSILVPQRNETLRLEVRMRGFRSEVIAVQSNLPVQKRNVTLQKAETVETMRPGTSSQNAPSNPPGPPPVRRREPPERPRAGSDRGGTVNPFEGR
ncbi:MAG: serine/threonine-protein kinase [bacterium]